jgi:single-stranded DNA-binding protein
MAIEKIKIEKLGRKTQPSKYGDGTYAITTIQDQKGRKIAGIGKWTEGWNVGDIIEGEIEVKKYTDKDGFEQTSLNIKNPNAKAWTPRAGSQASPIVSAYQLAASLAPVIFAGKKVTLEMIDKLAEELKSRISKEETPAAKTEEVKKAVPELNLDEEESTESTDSEDDEEPF